MPRPITIKTVYREETFEVAFRGDSFEVNIYSGEYVAYRVYTGDSIYVFSAPVNLEDKIKPLVDKITSKASREMRFDDNFYEGEYKVGKGLGVDEIREIVGLTNGRVREYGLNAEVIMVSRHTITHHYVGEYNVEAVDDRWIHELYIYPYTMYMGRLLATGKLLAHPDPRVIIEEVDNVAKALAKKIELQARARSFNPVYIGRWKTILAGDSACALYHELAHLLQADEPVKLPLETEIGAELKIVEDPFYPGPLQRMFDDELYPGWRRTLVEDGIVVDYLRTRLTSNGSRPGNGRGLFTRPKPMYHQLIVKSGDWSLNEAFEEFKKLVYVEDIVKAELHGNYINIVPETALMYEKGKWAPVKNLVIKIPVNQLNRIMIGVTRNLNIRYSYERNMPIYEVAPSTIIEAKITT